MINNLNLGVAREDQRSRRPYVVVIGPIRTNKYCSTRIIVSCVNVEKFLPITA